MKSQNIYRIRSDLSIIMENVDTVFRCLRIEIPVASELFYRAHHSVGFNSAKLARLYLDPFFRHRASVMASCHFSSVKYYGNLYTFLYIRRPRNYLQSFTAHIYLTDHQLVGIGMSFYLFYLSHHYLFQVFIHPVIAFTFGSGQCHPVHEFLISAIKIGDIGFKPVHCCIHICISFL